MLEARSLTKYYNHTPAVRGVARSRFSEGGRGRRLKGRHRQRNVGARVMGRKRGGRPID
jgi:hypothetical protein